MAMVNKIETALIALETAVKLIKVSGDYNYTLGNTELWGAAEPDQVNGANPHIYIVSWSDEPLWRKSNHRIQVTVMFRGITPPLHGRDMRENIMKLYADLEKAMFSDVTLGGAVDTIKRGPGSGSFYKEGNQGIFEVEYVLDLFYTTGAP
jgi:hypothetical protein